MNKKTILGYLIGPIGASFIGFISLPIMAWFFSVEDIGKISILQVATSLFVLVFCLGLDQAYVREYHENDNKQLLFKIVLLPSMFIASCVCAVVFILNQDIISLLLYNEKNIILTLLSIFCFIIALLLRFLSLVARMKEQALIFSLSQILQKASFLIFILLVVQFSFLYDIYGLVIANLLSLIVACALFIVGTKISISYFFNIEWDKEKFLKLIHFGLPLVLAGAANWGMNTLDRVFLRMFSNFEELGVYAMTMSLVGVVGIFSGVFNTIWTPLVYKWVSQEDVDIKKIEDISDNLLAIVFYVIVFFGLFAWTIPYFFPKEYNMIQYIIIPCLLCPLLYMLSETMAVGISIVKKTRLIMYVSIIAMLSNIIGNYLLVSKYGALGASIATVISFWLFYVLRTEFAQYIWIDIRKKKAYFVTTLLLIISIIHSFNFFNFYFTLFIWFILFLCGLILFKHNIKQLYQMFINVRKKT